MSTSTTEMPRRSRMMRRSRPPSAPIAVRSLPEKSSKGEAQSIANAEGAAAPACRVFPDTSRAGLPAACPAAKGTRSQHARHHEDEATGLRNRTRGVGGREVGAGRRRAQRDVVEGDLVHGATEVHRASDADEADAHGEERAVVARRVRRAA